MTVSSHTFTQTFRAGIILGGNASQVNGDLIAGFDKLGLHTGLKVMADLKPKLEGSVELLWSERGSSAKVRALDPFKIKLNYVEIPFVLAYKDWVRDDYYKMRFEVGGSVARLIKGTVETTTGDLDPEEFTETDFSMLVGTTFYSSENLAFSFRYTHSINWLANDINSSTFPRLKGYFLTFRLIYIL